MTAHSRASGATIRARQMMRGGALLAHLVGLAVMAIAWLINGVDGLLSAAIGAGAVVVFYGLGQWLEVLAQDLPLRRGMRLVVAGYVVRVVGIGAVLGAVLASGQVRPHVSRLWLVLAVVATVLAWVTGVVVVGSRQRVPIYDRHEMPSREDE